MALAIAITVDSLEPPPPPYEWADPDSDVQRPITTVTRTEDGRIMAAWTETTLAGSSRSAWWAKVKFSDDGGTTWGSETTLESRTGVENVIFAGEPVQMEDGTIVVPAYHHTALGNYNNKFFYSTDNGSTWNTRDAA